MVARKTILLDKLLAVIGIVATFTNVLRRQSVSQLVAFS